MERIRAVKLAHGAGWLALDDVVAVGVGRLEDGREGIFVSVRSDPAKVRASIPQAIDDVPVEVRRIGEVRAL